MICTEFELIAPWVCERARSQLPRPLYATAIGEVVHGEVRAGVVYENYTGYSCIVNMAIEPGYQLRRDFVAAIFDYPFNQLGVEKIIVMIPTTNAKSLNIAGRMGFVEEAQVADVFGRGVTMTIHGLYKDKCRFLGRRFSRLLEVA